MSFTVIKHKMQVLAAQGCVWWPSKKSGPSISFFSFPFLNFEADIFRPFGFQVLKLETLPLEWEVLIYNRIDMCKETAIVLFIFDKQQIPYVQI